VTLDVAAAIESEGFRVEVELRVERGETVALVGPNGAGKSTVLRAIAGLQPVTTGRVGFDGGVWDDPIDDVFVPPSERGVGMVFQQYLLFEHLSAIENVAFGLRARGAARDDAHAAAILQLERLGVGDVADQRPATLSGGEAQRVALARALAVTPSVLLLDEPLAALDATASASVRHDLRRGLDSVDACRLLVTHDPTDAYALADRVVVLEGGRVTQRGHLADLAAAPRSAYVAELLGTNLLEGQLVGGTFRSTDGFELVVGAHETGDGAVLAAVRPAAIALHRSHPEGSPRNVWAAVIEAADHGGDRVRVRLDTPPTLVVEVTPAGFAALAASEGDVVWASVKASEVTVTPD
jgi:molybdate transport system ATP-binding protein